VQDNPKQNNANWLAAKGDALARRLLSLADNPRLRIYPAKSGALTATFDDLQLHSAYNPVAEADKFAERAIAEVPAGAVIVLLGMGLGYPALALRKRWNGPLAIVEAEASISKVALENLPISELGDASLIVENEVSAAIEELKRFAEQAGGWEKLHILEYPPAVKLNSSFYDELAASIRARASNDSEPLGILVVTPMYGGSLPIARYCASAFERLGHRVETLDNEIFNDARLRIEGISHDRSHRAQLTELLVTLMSEMITARALDRAVDLVWLVAQSPMSIPVANELKKHNIRTAFWFVEEWQYFTYWQSWASVYDFFFTIQRGQFLQTLAERGVKRARYLPLAADPFIHRPLELTAAEKAEFGSELSHVGAGYRNRRQVFSGLTGFDFKLWGNEWQNAGLLSSALQRDGARISTEDSVRIFNATGINLNLHSSQFHDGVNPDGDYLNPRTFEIAACSGFQLVDRRSDLSEHFEVGREIVVFNDAREIPPLARHYLAHPEERREIAEAGRKRVLRDHLYDMRMADALTHILSHEPARASKQHPNHIENLMREAKDQPDLLSLLEEMRGMGVVTLDDVVEKIRQHDGDLTDAELIFLLMFEFRRWAAEKDLV
jgi:spore maturation protein CgeB